ncbi:butyrophilin subfamily 3 member A3-like [Pangasianodon hypophthalmus]|uniref:butyrophilin subfamily 3 member A3-like n=1 Tax=Pangasianodon hypophthalmus TaxID=310915 RepID=UPI00230735FB|nr:butyrophilin subfamily 3 member A3-like [Pangasianodon hypophthalmus]
MMINCLSGIMFLCVTLLILYSVMESQSERLQVVGPEAPLVAVAGEDLVLPCFIKPSTSAVDMTVEWFKLDVGFSLVHFYNDHDDRNENQAQPYRRRTSLFKEELQKGNASLKLSALQVSDEGEYKCLIEDKSWSDDITVQVTVEVQGSHPVITMERYDNSGGINLVCESRGWNPEPEVLWLDREGAALSAEDTQTHRDTEGFSVKCHITVYDYSDSNRFYCRFQQIHHMMEAEIIINKLAEMEKFAEPQRQRVKEELAEIKNYAVDVTLDPDSAHPKLRVSDDGKQVTCGDTPQDLPDTPQRFANVLGKQSFSRIFYYEVQVRGKTQWTLGVMRQNINRKEDITLTPKTGFWTVEMRNENEYKAHAGPDVRLTLIEKPVKVGVYVDYEEGQVSFYDVEASSHIYSFTAQSFNEELYPFLSPGLNEGGKNSAPLIITAVNE